MIQIEDGQNKKKVTSENNRLTHREKMPKRQTAKKHSKYKIG